MDEMDDCYEIEVYSIENLRAEGLLELPALSTLGDWYGKSI